MRTVPRRIDTERLCLEATSSRHADDLWLAAQASSGELELWMPWAIDPSFADTLAFTIGAQNAWDKGSGWNFTITSQSEVIGSIGLDHYEPMIGSCHLGYWLRSDHSGRGLMTEAAASVIGLGFEHISLHRIELHAAVGNEPSGRIAEKLGFTYEGRLRDAGRGADGWHDMRVYGLLARDRNGKETP
jgi:ribosomal-protein-serine acetyltransferase